MKQIGSFYTDDIDSLINRLMNLRDSYPDNKLIVKPEMKYPTDLSENGYIMYNVYLVENSPHAKI